MRGVGRTWLAALAAGALIGAPAAGADRGVSIDVGRIDVEQDLERGGGYRLPTIGVSNPGDERTDYRLQVSYVEGQTTLQPDRDWFRFSPARLTLVPGQTRPVRVRLIVPTDAEPGRYEALVGARIAMAGAGTQVGAGAAARLSFEVAPSGFLHAWWLRLKRAFEDASPWSYLVPALVLLGVAVWQARRRLTVTVARRG